MSAFSVLHCQRTGSRTVCDIYVFWYDWNCACWRSFGWIGVDHETHHSLLRMTIVQSWSCDESRYVLTVHLWGGDGHVKMRPISASWPGGSGQGVRPLMMMNSLH